MMIRSVPIGSFLLLMGLTVVFAEGFFLSWHHPHKSHTSLSFLKKPHRRQLQGGWKDVARGGVRYAEPPSDDEKSGSLVGKSVAAFGSIWGSMGVVYILSKAITRVLPIAIEPFRETSTLVFTKFHWR